ncbi:hypothetical protein DFH11DRAFT_1545437 [Phellopilus nigrolimitatus]|nr:hypothetical protein DFH11DRAFT_1545437 [Phellopilus nigrolimitatus]
MTSSNPLSNTGMLFIDYSFHANERLCNFTQWATNASDILLMRVLALFSEGRKENGHLSEKSNYYGSNPHIGSRSVYPVIVDEAGIFAYCDDAIVVSPLLAALYWGTPLLFELNLMALALYKASDFWRTVDNQAGLILTTFLSSAAFPCVIGSRLMVHLKEAAERGVNGENAIDKIYEKHGSKQS